MPATYHEQPVTILRPATKVDYQFKDDLGEQVLIRTTDGIECVVPTSELDKKPDEVAPKAPPKVAVAAPSGNGKDTFGVKKVIAKSKATATKKKKSR